MGKKTLFTFHNFALKKKLVELHDWLVHFINWKCQCMHARFTLPDSNYLFGTPKISGF